MKSPGELTELFRRQGLKVTPQQYRVETIVLPLIDNSIYTGLAGTLNGKPEPLDALPVPKRNIFSVAGRFDKEKVLQHALQGWCPPVPLFRRLGFRTEAEINQERYALKVLRGDFANLPAGPGASDRAPVSRVLHAVQH